MLPIGKFLFKIKSKSRKAAVGKIPTAAFVSFTEKSGEDKNKRANKLSDWMGIAKIVKKNKDASLTLSGFLEKISQKE